jgi:thiol-disulfide isomerase/thioredoxin
MKQLIKYLFFLSLMAFIACDIVEEPYTEGGGDNPIPQDSAVRKVLIEDYTGFKCPNCPSAANEAHELKQVYGEQLIIMAVHAGSFAVPDAGGDYTDDLRTTCGNDLNSFFGISSYPSGMVNRREFSGNRILSFGNWGSSVASILAEDVLADIKIETLWQQSTQEVQIIVVSEFLFDDNEPYSLCVYLLEDSIITWQKNNNPLMGAVPDISNYVQMHVLRDAVNSTWGDEIISSGPTIGCKDSSNYSYDFSLHPEIDPNQCRILAFIYNKNTYEIIQVEEESVK